MKTVLKLLKKELREWKKQDADNKYYYKGEEDHPWAKAAFKDCKKHIAELEKSIAILKTHGGGQREQLVAFVEWLNGNWIETLTDAIDEEQVDVYLKATKIK